MKNRGLGRGLSALMADVHLDEPATERPHSADRTLPIDAIAPNPDQPRRSFDEAALDELAASIRERGILQPLIVRPRPRGDATHELVAGERRWRAAQRAQLHDVPVIVSDLDDTEALEIAIVENIQRADLSPVEEARGYRQLIDRFGHTQEQLARSLGKSRSHIANLMRLLGLPDEVLAHLEAGRLTAGHARALVTATDPAALAREVVARGLSVRQAEALARQSAVPAKAHKPRATPEKDADTRAIEQDLAAHLRMRVSIEHKDIDGAGELRVRYRDLDQLDLLCQMLSASLPDGTR
ncbi:ParB/RepB/Spo0J family partition protein [Rhodovulum sp. 12E13]|nr:ParB/RepB/Spo0J family partition protein [Rhodovulum sp. 12E13]